ncbi:PAS domain S-box-containing protein/diguanylate cyclase (GGDEF) domain-containing protein [Nitrosomonas sp. Nm51]|uniref:EAL domain-containing protein n=1 Tax=Nitrosomonas sp. Nm51 TaxID=133720 RepID=UPI0008AFA3CD|nr:EAL domain-containing protein [Nitrosomonas sp. Nm51]SER08529.1 PAS domain S-box-containing protein/diguanylate cyclase (GGDEF) domain-containing protein [Nitrosomonas sp. Nm51]
MIYLRSFRKRINTFVLRIAILLAIVATLAYSEVLERLDFMIYDGLSVLIQYPQNSDIVIVAIDEQSLDILGRWPWSREIHAKLINRLKSIDNQRMALDLLFSEPQLDDTYADQLLAAAIALHGNVVLPLVPVSTSYSESLYLAAPDPLLRHNAVLGHTDIEIDSDGIARRAFLYAGINAPTWPALAQVLFDPATAVEPYLLSAEDKKPGNQPRYWLRAEEALIPFIEKPGSFRQVSYAGVLFDDNILASLKDKTVIVGVTAAGLGTRFATPVSSANRQPMTGVEWHANVYSMLQHNRAIYPVSSTWITLISLAWVALILTGISWTKKNLTIPILLFASAAGLFLAYLLLKINHVWIPPGAALLGTLAIYPLSNWRRINQFVRAYLITKIRSSTALESIKDGVIITDAHDHVTYINNGAEKILRTEFSHIKGKNLQQVLNLRSNINNQPEDLSVRNILPSGLDGPGMLECRLRTKYGDERSVRITRNQLYDERKVLIGSVIAMSDITDTIELAEQVANQENYDALTKLPNRSKLLSQFDHMIQAAENNGNIITAFFVALDNFKKINDAMGHQAGDKLLKMVSIRLHEAVQHNDIVARWGGDEFILLFDYLDNIDSISEMAQKILDVIRQKFEIDDMEVFVAASIGISFYPESGLTSETVLKKAGTAMYGAKRDGGNRFDYYSHESSIVWTRDRLELEKELRSAILNRELQVLFQPIIDAKTHHITRMEALVRWPHPTRGFLSPSEFIPLAENVGLIEQLGELVLRMSCLSAYQLLQLGYPVNVAVNVNPRQLLNKDFLQTIVKALHDTQLPACSLILEITESSIVKDIERVGIILRAIKELDIMIALDDFGTGYSSLTLLRELPIDILKIDKSFIRTLDQNQNDLTIVQAIIGLGNNMGLAVVAEGVETAQQNQILLQHHCYYQQGYFFSRPVPYKALLELVHEKNERLQPGNLFDAAADTTVQTRKAVIRSDHQ